MVGTMIDLGSAGIYTIALFISTIIGIPMNSIVKIANPIVAASWERKDLAKIKELYIKSASNLFIIGVLFLIGIWASIDLLFQVIPNGEIYEAGKYVVLFLGLAKLLDMATSINGHIIAYSPLYQFNLYLGLFLGVINIIFNIILIPRFGIIGAALATMFSMFLFNLCKVLFVWIKFKMQPFSKSSLLVLIIGLVAYSITLILPKLSFPIINIVINSAVITLVYISSILYFNISPELTQLKQQVLEKIGIKH